MKPNEINVNQGFSQKVVSTSCFVSNSLPTSGDFCCLLITFANNLDPDQARQNVGPGLDPKLFDTQMVLKKIANSRVSPDYIYNVSVFQGLARGNQH